MPFFELWIGLVLFGVVGGGVVGVCEEVKGNVSGEVVEESVVYIHENHHRRQNQLYHP